MQMDEGLDTGPVIMERAVPIRPETTATSLHDELAALGAAMIVEAVDMLAAKGKLDSEAQPETGATYAHRLKKEDGRIDWNKSATDIDRAVRALNPWPGTWCKIGTDVFKIKEATPLTSLSPLTLTLSPMGRGEFPGCILDREGRIACGGGTVLKILRLQPPGAKAMDFVSALNGGYLKPGDALE